MSQRRRELFHAPANVMMKVRRVPTTSTTYIQGDVLKALRENVPWRHTREAKHPVPIALSS